MNQFQFGCGFVFVLQESWVMLLLLSLLPLVQPFYVPGVAPIDFHQNDPVEIKVRMAACSALQKELYCRLC